MIPIEQLNSLPLFHKETIPAAYLDAMGHMNVRHYMGLFDQAAWNFFSSIGMDLAYYKKNNDGVFALQHFIRYLAEVHSGESVAVRIRVLERSAKRVYFIHFLINESTGKLAATMEALGSHADLSARRTSPFPDNIAKVIDELLKDQQRLEWQPPLCGVIRA
jgi:acyl-CoA thioester hydrolase